MFQDQKLKTYIIAKNAPFLPKAGQYLISFYGEKIVRKLLRHI